MDRKHQTIFEPWLISIFLCMGLILTMLPANDARAAKPQIKSYLDGMEYQEKGRYKEAIKAFAAAISQDGMERAKVHFYGMRYDDYMPHREKGICHYRLDQYEEAIEELEISLRQLPSDEAQKYIDLAKTAFEKLVQSGDIEIAQTPAELKQIREAKAINQHGVGVIIGNRDYKDKDIPMVRYAIRDAVMIKKYLIKTFGYREGNIILKTNATKGTLENIFGSASKHKSMLYDYISPGKSDLFVYYSGHGAPNLASKKGYILPVDGNPNNVAISG